MSDENNGYQRRKRDEDHDLLVEIHTIVKEYTDAFKSHEDKDEERFGNVHKRVDILSRNVYIGIGIFLLANVILVPLLLAYFKGPT